MTQTNPSYGPLNVVAFQIPQKLLDAVDAYAYANNLSRSAVLRIAAAQLVNLDYKDGPTQEEKQERRRKQVRENVRALRRRNA